ncbi:bifunctional 2-polyprenyl-6-hydroxyphenol methylase/3-demethylubiquinol 3-O-methyltransferase UbiG [Bradyrhizobium sp. HKCCYLR20261]|uniref:bifunctional 2-polyprenyl-6-hydroxyphenol methylase/3-demethylubiquinol 3-O-methyltransferase UbiG n=1 Tax=Bradyrhizobium sp. HKCCYLR20261 TaxID=3420760 RepID=UPI003EBF65A5
MLYKDAVKPAFAATAEGPSTIDPAEIARFSRLAEEWWKPDGAFKLVHAFNAARVEYLCGRLPALVGRDPAASEPLAGLEIIDVGCGAGIVTEPLSRLGAATLGIDAAERNVLVAADHARKQGASVAYRHALAEDLLSEGARADIVLTLEVVEHVADLARFVGHVADLVRPGGLLVIGTLNRTPVSFVKAIIGAEYILGWLPRGTHDWRRFVKPAELQALLAPRRFVAIETVAVELNPLTMRWSIGGRPSTNYLQIFRRMP